MSKRIHELAKEWSQNPKDLLIVAERVGIRGKRPQSTLTDDEVTRLRDGLGITPRPAVTVGSERVVAERVVTQRDSSADQLVTAIEQTTETRLSPNVIRRRTAREVLKREELPPTAPESEPTASDIPPSLDFEPDIPPALVDEIPPSASEPEVEHVPPAAARMREVVEHAAPEPVEVAAPVEVEQPAVETAAEEPAPVVVERPAARVAPATPAAPRVRAPAPAPAAARTSPAPAAPGAAPPPGFEEMRGVKVLGKIDLRKAVAPPGASPGFRPAADAPGATQPAGDGAPKKKKGRKVIKKPDMANMSERDFYRGGKRPQKRKALPGKEQKKTEITVPRASKRVIRISEMITVGDLAKAMGVKAGEVLKKLIDMGMMATINQMLDHDTAVLLASEFEYQVENVAFDVEQALETEQDGAAGELLPRAPVITMMGHVDHGKTSLLDAIRATNVAEGEAGGITQHIGAYTVDVRGRQVTFLDTPGHEAFTAMRARGAKVTDIVILVVAADDGIMPQTREAIDHARAAEVPIIVAINKIDKPDANPDRVRNALSEHGLISEAWGGDTIMVEVSAKQKTGLDQLLEMILLQAEVLELKADPHQLAKGAVVEAKLERGRGPVATVL